MTIIRIDVEKDLQTEKHTIINKLTESTKKGMYILVYTNTCGHCTALMGDKEEDTASESTWGRAMEHVPDRRLIIQCNYECVDGLIETVKPHMKENNKIKGLIGHLGEIHGVPSLNKIKKSGKNKECQNTSQENAVFDFLKIKQKWK
jgi:hypothetical protein